MNPGSLKQFIESGNIFSGDDYILLAVSGGIDSTVMAHLFYQAKFRFAIAHCDFCLRGTESDGDANFTQQLATALKVPFFIEKFDTAAIASNQGISIQMAARDLRYKWFETVRQENGFDYVATAHHLDDQAETFLINLIRGTGIAGLHGIPVKNGHIIRPLMFAYRKNIEQYALRHQISYRMDHSNNETKYLRNKIRHEIIPLLRSINPEFTHGLTESIGRIAAFEKTGNQTLKNWCRDVITIEGSDHYAEIKHLLAPDPVEPYAWALLSPFGFNETQVANIIDCLGKENSKIFCSPTHRLVKDRTRLVISPIEQAADINHFYVGSFDHKKTITEPLILRFERIIDVTNYKIHATGNIASLDFDKLQFPLLLRKWQQGDVFYPLGMKRKKKLSDFFIDQKFSLREKEQTWILCSGNEIVWIVGRRIDNRFRVTAETTKLLRIETSDK